MSVVLTKASNALISGSEQDIINSFVEWEALGAKQWSELDPGEYSFGILDVPEGMVVLLSFIDRYMGIYVAASLAGKALERADMGWEKSKKTRARNAIDAAKRWALNPSEENRIAAREAGNSIWSDFYVISKAGQIADAAAASDFRKALKDARYSVSRYQGGPRGFDADEVRFSRRKLPVPTGNDLMNAWLRHSLA